MANYYVSTQRGSDTNDGLTPATPWKTIQKALDTITAPPGDEVYVNVGPGTYNEKPVVMTPGTVTSKIFIRADIYAQWVTGDKPGRVLVSGRDAQGRLTSGVVWNGNGKSYVDVQDFDFDGSLDTWCVDGGPSPYTGRVFTRCRVLGGKNGFYCTRVLGCEAYVSGTAFETSGPGATQCVAVGASVGFQQSTVNCVALGCTQGFVQGGAFESIAIGCKYGFYDCPSQFSMAQNCDTGFYGGLVAKCYTSGCTTVYDATYIPGGEGPGGITDLQVEAGDKDYFFVPPSARGLGFYGRGITYTPGSETTFDLSTERVTGNINQPGTAVPYRRSVGFWPSVVPEAGDVLLELQEYVVGVWTTRTSITVPVANLQIGKLNIFDFPTPTLSSSNQWRIRITASGGAEVADATLIASSGSYPAITIYEFSDADTDGNGVPISTAYRRDIGLAAPPDLTLDWSTYKNVPPGIKINGWGYKILQTAAKAGATITKEVWVQHHGSTTKPMLILRGPGITTQTITATVDADIWEKLTVTATPTVDGVLELVLLAQDPTTGAYSIFSV